MLKVYDRPFHRVYCIDPERMSDQHLKEEFRFIKGVIKLIKKDQHDPQSTVGRCFALKFSDYQHIDFKFYFSKVIYLVKRIHSLYTEMLERELVTEKSKPRSFKEHKKIIRKVLWNDYTPSTLDEKTSMESLFITASRDIKEKKYYKNIKYNKEVIDIGQYHTILYTGDF